MYNYSRIKYPLEMTMRRALMLMACSALVLQPALAFKTYEVTLKMSRAASSLQTAQSDGYACWKRTSPSLSFNGYHQPYLLNGYDVHRPAQVASFVSCMQNMGYRIDPNGHQVARFRHVSET